MIEGSGSSGGDGVFTSWQYGLKRQMLLRKKCVCVLFKPGGLGVTSRPGGVGRDGDGLGGTGIPIIGLKPGNGHLFNKYVIASQKLLNCYRTKICLLTVISLYTSGANGTDTSGQFSCTKPCLPKSTTKIKS